MGKSRKVQKEAFYIKGLERWVGRADENPDVGVTIKIQRLD